MHVKKKHRLFLTLLRSFLPAEEIAGVQAEAFETFEEEIEEKYDIIIKKRRIG